jgi:hypothetical protein
MDLKEQKKKDREDGGVSREVGWGNSSYVTKQRCHAGRELYSSLTLDPLPETWCLSVADLQLLPRASLRQSGQERVCMRPGMWHRKAWVWIRSANSVE